MKNIIEVRDVKTLFDDRVIHNKISLSVPKGSIYGLLGPSGCGKTTLLREMVMLQKFNGGEIEILGHNLNNISYEEAMLLRREWGVLFQSGALFSSLNLRENIALPLVEYTDLSQAMIKEIVEFKISIVGLKSEDANLYPSQISGGMKKKAALARALAMDPKLLFLDEPTSGLDPISAREFDALILKLRSLLNLTIVMVSHDLQSVYDTLDKVAVLDNKSVVYEGDLKNILNVENEFIRTFFKGMK
ncbi:MAG: sulfate ABC transporter ATP-binding protein [Sulfurimonas sp. RIFCSPHIGHO2_12_FULL_36_9]|uniref:ABC transporter ATP-binding protein n=1 Tax=Sulfurimonas sp. RIFCSPLOWO2_12_36_12 TaxID=1802253 RepID=UPI0008C3A9A8|nr:ATP-binding cassette domain-containing protein [Sulfurimonas sp. RIFCSPLOWO2_12_36_12]OHD96424.1 MAG: sulfate ABC transporter ATP-binding protein [Sulfurimonas sp. RIFCSPHIGHO2_12_FULL_36_9]OHD97559.1 MAG: sulfate ABC transporter ATP-binding protein [Sulfurimonas sp. RIFCSPLOWO2_02_FULL_36_28]OHE00450.1 MAG: sulfate ABC transporter ATP-binding protein [Sulfurimonas sp. RIFCSPLOWO2_12_36_12]OHE01330.1 MAG: sulfate ABC transporter ATP-binding protein [Sulfurimonas sp. RIFCSPLOWO2_12_FULL_36_74